MKLPEVLPNALHQPGKKRPLSLLGLQDARLRALGRGCRLDSRYNLERTFRYLRYHDLPPNQKVECFSENLVPQAYAEAGGENIRILLSKSSTFGLEASVNGPWPANCGDPERDQSGPSGCHRRMVFEGGMERVRLVLQGFASTNIEMQAFFRKWAREDRAVAPGAGVFVDYAEIRFLAELNRNLLRECDDDSLIDQLARNLHLAGELQREIWAEASRITAGTSKGAADVPTTHLKDVFAALAAPSGFARGHPPGPSRLRTSSV